MLKQVADDVHAWQVQRLTVRARDHERGTVG